MHEGLFIVRLVAGVLMAAHGSQKLFGWFGGYGIAGTGGFFESLGSVRGGCSRRRPRSANCSAACSSRSGFWARSDRRSSWP
jgi:hypothetical protein